MSQKELGQPNGTETHAKGSLLAIIRSWGKNPKIAEGRAAKPGVLTYNLRCRFGVEPLFNAALTVSEDRSNAYLKNTHIPVDTACSVERLVVLADSAETDWVDIDTGEGTLLVKTTSLRSALRAFGFIV